MDSRNEERRDLKIRLLNAASASSASEAFVALARAAGHDGGAQIRHARWRSIRHRICNGPIKEAVGRSSRALVRKQAGERGE